MKIRDLYTRIEELMEAPLEGYHLLGTGDTDFDPSRPESPAWTRDQESSEIRRNNPEPFFRKSDRKMIHNPQTVETLQRVFGRIGLRIHFVFINDRENMNFGNMIDFPLQGKGILGYVSNEQHIEYVQALRSRDPESFIVIFRGNDPDGYSEHVSLSPWMMIHRLAHIITPDEKRTESYMLGSFRDILNQMGSYFPRHPSENKNVTKYRSEDNDAAIAYHMFFPMRSARLAKLSTDGNLGGEIIREIFVQTLFNPDWKMKPITQDIIEKSNTNGVKQRVWDLKSYYRQLILKVDMYKKMTIEDLLGHAGDTIYL